MYIKGFGSILVSTISSSKLCKFNVNQGTFVFCVVQKYLNPFPELKLSAKIDHEM